GLDPMPAIAALDPMSVRVELDPMPAMAGLGPRSTMAERDPMSEMAALGPMSAKAGPDPMPSGRAPPRPRRLRDPRPSPARLHLTAAFTVTSPCCGQLWCWLVPATVELRAAGWRSGARTPRIAWTIGPEHLGVQG